MKFSSIAVLVISLSFAIAARAQTTAFTYQGQLSSSNAPANGLYDFRFRLFNDQSTLVAGPLTNAPTGVTNGSFMVTLDFGSAVFDGSDRWLEIGVRAYGDTNTYTVLSPMQPITSTPYAIRAINAANASNAVSLTAPLQGTNITGIVPAANLPANIAFLNSNQTFSASNTFTGVVTANNSANAFSGAFTGNGSGLASVPATSLTGTLPDARLSANVALQSNPNLNFAGTVSATNFVGAGHGLTNVPGAFFWVIPTNGMMYPNVGYICTNNVTPVTMTLPPTNAASIGDTFKMCAVGAAGWIIAQTNGETIFAGNLASSIGQIWQAVGPSANWSAVAASADGTKLVAVINNGNIYTSTNSGATWVQRASSLGNLYWSSVASSADGTELVAAVGYTIYNAAGSGYIYTSTDSGADWTARLGSAQWTGVASSADGTKLVAVIYNGQIWTSTDSGADWTARNSASYWTAVASSADGSKLVAATAGYGIWTSTNSGTNWLQRTSSSRVWSAVACSSDGTRLIATASDGSAWLSADGGATWIPQSLPVSGQLTSAASSSDGARLAAVVGGNSSSVAGAILGSSNSGGIWTQLTGAPALSWSSIASSADGSLLAATTYGGNIYVSSQNATSTGTAGYLIGAQHSAVELIYAGNGIFLPLSHEGVIRAY